MSTLSSWIDPDEISELMPLLLPKRPEKIDTGDGPDTEAEAGLPADDIVEAGTESVESSVTEFEEEVAEAEAPAAEEEAESIDSTENADEDTEPEIDFDSPEAYDADAFPEPGELLDDVAIPARQAAAVQAAVALERARDRASEGGLLKNGSAGEPKLSDPEPPAHVEEEAAVSSPETFEETETAAADLPAEEEAELVDVEEQPAAEPGNFRDRLSRFAESTVQLTGGSSPTVTDFQSYPLFPGANGDGGPNPRSMASIVRMNRLLSQLPGQPNGSSEKTAQIAMEGENQWLCVLTQGSASGGVCASLRIPGPISTETADQLHSSLRTALTGPLG